MVMLYFDVKVNIFIMKYIPQHVAYKIYILLHKLLFWSQLNVQGLLTLALHI